MVAAIWLISIAVWILGAPFFRLWFRAEMNQRRWCWCLDGCAGTVYHGFGLSFIWPLAVLPFLMAMLGYRVTYKK